MTSSLDRRDFLKAGAIATTGVLASPSALFGASPRRVIVVGAGLAGLAAAHGLAEAGIDVWVVEARDDVGGRVRTKRRPFGDGLHAELGALHATDRHARLGAWCERVGLELQLSSRRPDSELHSVLEMCEQRFESRSGVNWPIALDAAERGLPVGDLWARYVTPDDVVAVERGDDPLGHVTVPEFLRSRGASRGAREILTLGESVDDESARSWLLREGPRRSRERRSIRGGNDLLPALLADRLGDRVVLGARVVGVSQTVREARVSIAFDSRLLELSADRVIVTTPPSVTARLRTSPRLSAAKRAAIAQTPSAHVVRVALESARRWQADDLQPEGAFEGSQTRVFDATFNQVGARGIAIVEAEGADAVAFARASERARTARALSSVDRLLPGFGVDFSGGLSIDWGADPWARGSTARFRPGQLERVVAELARAEDRIHFAGDHTSRWVGVMEGALDSGERAAREVIAALA